jgi:hypothetical protein
LPAEASRLRVIKGALRVRSGVGAKWVSVPM